MHRFSGEARGCVGQNGSQKNLPWLEKRLLFLSAAKACFWKNGEGIDECSIQRKVTPIFWAFFVFFCFDTKKRITPHLKHEKVRLENEICTVRSCTLMPPLWPPLSIRLNNRLYRVWRSSTSRLSRPICVYGSKCEKGTVCPRGGRQAPTVASPQTPGLHPHMPNFHTSYNPTTFFVLKFLFPHM